VWLQDERHLPTSLEPVSTHPNWNFASSRPLPDGWINNSFVQWDGRAEIRWKDRGIILTISASPPLTSYVVYSPDRISPFFCFEPVSHGVDAYNLPPGPEAHGLVILSPGAMLAAECRFAARRVDA
jgi:aldose 1-epimerase